MYVIGNVLDTWCQKWANMFKFWEISLKSFFVTFWADFVIEVFLPFAGKEFSNFCEQRHFRTFSSKDIFELLLEKESF
jgi:hypothetical protein